MVGGTLACTRPGSGSIWKEGFKADSPANAVYIIENEPVQLENGLAEKEAAPGSASKIRIALQGEVLYGDLNHDTERDAVLFLTYQGGGSGTHFYLTVALQDKGGFSGKNAIWLGDRIGPPTATVSNGLITVKYLDRSQSEPMAAAPRLEMTRYFMVSDSELQEIPITADEAVYQGWLTAGHEVRSFLPCNETAELWLSGVAIILDSVILSYEKSTAGMLPYTPVFAILAGTRTPPPDEGFGSDYQGALLLTRLVQIWPRGNCRSDFILLDAPLPGSTVSSPLTIRGQARGTWFFEGDFSIILRNEKGEKIAAGYAAAKGEWMTENFVGFEGSITFTNKLSGERGTLILQKDNPSGRAQFDDRLEIPLQLK